MSGSSRTTERARARRVLVVAADFKPRVGGVAEYAHQMARAFAACGAETRVIAPQFPADRDFDRASPLSIQRSRPGTPVRGKGGFASGLLKVAALASLRAHMHRACEDHAPDIVYLPSMYPLGAFFPYSRIRVVTTFHGGELLVHGRASRWPGANRWLLERVSRRCELILANSRYTARVLEEKRVRPDKIFVTGCGVDWERFRDPPGADRAKGSLGLSGKRVLLTLGRLDERKGVDTVIECLPALRRRYPDVFYVVVGAGPMESSLKVAIENRGLTRCVRLTGGVTDREVVTYLAACDVFVLPNRETSSGSVEGFGIVFLEANACGKPVIAGRSGGAVDAVVPEQTGLLVNPYSAEEIERALSRLLADRTLAAKLGRQGRERVARCFTWDVVAGRAAARILSLVDK